MEETNKKKTKKVCAVAVCDNPKHAEVIYHRFPKEESTRKHWIVKCKRGDSFKTQHATVCSTHFTENDYERDLKSELLGLPPKKRLKKDAVPSLKLNLDPETKENLTNVEVILIAVREHS